MTTHKQISQELVDNLNKNTVSKDVFSKDYYSTGMMVRTGKFSYTQTYQCKNDPSQKIMTARKNGDKITLEDLELLKQCNGVHDSVEEIINCKSCEVLLK